MKTYLKPIVAVAGFAVLASAAVPVFAQDTGNDAPAATEMPAPPPPGMGPNGRGPGDRKGRMMGNIDTDGNGAISKEEFASMGPSMFTEADANSDGNVTADELVDHMLRQELKRRAEQMIAMFDTNEDGQVSADELKERQDEMFAAADVDNSGAIEADEMGNLRGMGGDRGGHGGPGGPGFGGQRGGDHQGGGWRHHGGGRRG